MSENTLDTPNDEPVEQTDDTHNPADDVTEGDLDAITTTSSEDVRASLIEAFSNETAVEPEAEPDTTNAEPDGIEGSATNTDTDEPAESDAGTAGTAGNVPGFDEGSPPAGGSGAEPPSADDTPVDGSSPADGSSAPPASSDKIRIGNLEFDRSLEKDLEELITRQLEAALKAQPASAEPAPPAEPEPPAGPPRVDPEAFLDPAVGEQVNELIADLYSRVNATQEFVQKEQLSRVQQEQIELQAAADRTLNAYAEKYGLTAEQRAALDLAAARCAAAVDRDQPVEQWMSQAVELALYSTAEFRDVVLRAEIDARLEAERERIRKEAETTGAARAQAEIRKRNAGSLAGGGSSPARKPARPRTPQETRQAMIEAFAAVENAH